MCVTNRGLATIINIINHYKHTHGVQTIPHTSCSTVFFRSEDLMRKNKYDYTQKEKRKKINVRTSYNNGVFLVLSWYVTLY